MTTAVQKSQIIKSINNLHLKGTIDKGLEKNSLPLFSSSTDGAINISEIGLYQVINTIIDQLLDIKNNDKITRRIGINVSSIDYYTTSLNRYSLKNREKQLYDVFQKAPVITNNTLLDLSNNIDGSVSSTDLTCQIVYKDGLFDNSDGTPINSDDITLDSANLISDEFISLQTPTKYDANGVRKSGEQKFVLRDELSGGQEAYDNAYNNAYNSALANGDEQNEADTAGTTAGNNARNTYNNENNKYFYRATDNCIEFLRETDTDTTMNNLTDAINSISEFTATINTTSKTITITQPNTDGIIIDNISLFTDGIQLPIQNFRSLRYKQFIANTISKTTNLNIRGSESQNDTKLALLVVGYDVNGNPVKKYSEDALFEFFGKMTYEFIKLNNNHIGKEENYPGSYKLTNASVEIASHHLNSVQEFIEDNTVNQTSIKRINIIKQLLNIKKNGSFGSIGFNSTGTLKEQYGYFSENLFSDSNNPQNIPYRDDDENAIGLYQIMNNLIYQLQFLKKKIQKREKELIEILKNSNNNSTIIDLDSTKVNNLQAKTSYCQTQGELSSTQWKPSFIEINNSTDYTSSIEYKYSQDALYELCGRWLNELLKLNNGHSGNENIYPGFYDITKTVISQHHLNSVTTFIQL